MSEKIKFLIIDDDVALSESILDIVELEDYSTDTSYTAADGIKKVESDYYHIVLLDMKLPDSDGLTVLEHIKQTSPDTEVIIFTAYAKMDTVIEAMEKDAFSFLPKPFDMPYLLTIIKRALEKQNIALENRLLYEQTILGKRDWEETFDSISDLVSIHDMDFNIIRCNKAVKEKLNVEYRDIIGKKCHKVFYGSNKPWQECPFVRCKETLQPESEEEHCMGGTFLISCFPRFDKAGRFKGVVHIARDITELRKKEESIRMLSMAIEQSPVIVEVTDSKGNIEYVNPRFCKITGYTKEEVIGKNPRILKSDEKSNGEYIELWRTITSGGEWFGEFHNKKKNGELYWESASISPIRDKKGEITHYIGIKEIITKRKKAEKTIHHLASFPQKDINPILELDDSGAITFNNLAALNVVKKFNIHEGLEVFLPKNIKEIIEALKGGEKKQFYNEIKIRNLIFGEIIHFIPAFNVLRIYAQDISEHKRIEDKIRASYKMSSLGVLTAGVFHEILNPVNIISSHIQLLLLEAEKGSRTEEDLNSVQEEIARIIKITDGLLRFSRTGDYKFNEIDLNNILEETISIVEPDMKMSSIEIIREYDYTIPTITASADKLRQVFLNFITNARDAMKDGGTLTVKTQIVRCRRLDKLKGKFVEISFADTGCGISENIKRDIFNPFFTTKEPGRGTGLGLSTSYQIIEKHGGTMAVENNVNKGTIFAIDLPIKK